MQYDMVYRVTEPIDGAVERLIGNEGTSEFEPVSISFTNSASFEADFNSGQNSLALQHARELVEAIRLKSSHPSDSFELLSLHKIVGHEKISIYHKEVNPQ